MDCTNIIGEKNKIAPNQSRNKYTGTGRTRRTDRGTGKSH